MISRLDVHEIARRIGEIEDKGPAPDDATGRMITAIHPDDEMYQYIAGNPAYAGNPPGHYFHSGAKMMQRLSSILKLLDVDLARVDSFLEFACGYGRFTRHLILHLDPSKIVGTDLYREAVDFQKATFGVNGFYSELVPEDLEIPGRHDVIFVASLFSHLPEAVWGKWLKKLYDVLAPGGVLIFSTHGTSALPEGLSLPASGFLFHRASESKTHSTENYGTTYVSSDYVHGTVDRETGQPVAFEMVKGLFAFQDVFVVRRPAAGDTFAVLN